MITQLVRIDLELQKLFVYAFVYFHIERTYLD